MAKKQYNNPLLASAGRRFIQNLFQEIADKFHGEVVLEKWYKDGSADINFRWEAAVGNCSIKENVTVRIEDCPNSSGIGLVRITTPEMYLHVSPIASVIIAIVTR